MLLSSNEALMRELQVRSLATSCPELTRVQEIRQSAAAAPVDNKPQPHPQQQAVAPGKDGDDSISGSIHSVGAAGRTRSNLRNSKPSCPSPSSKKK
jgi:hypothetical protein